MILNELFAGKSPIVEGVSLSSPIELAAYMVAVGEAYEAAPVHDPSADPMWTMLKRHTIDTLMPRVKGSGINIVYTEDDPYQEFGSNPKMMIRAMLYDIVANRRLIIYSGGIEDHPNFTNEENAVFRTIHDYFTHGKLLSTFKQNLLAIDPNILKRKPTQDELAKALPQVSLTKGGNMGHGLTARGELNSVSAHMRLAPNACAPALFTEVAGQIAYFMCTAKYAPQKVAILHGFDYKRLGVTIPGSAADARKNEVIEFLKNAQPDDVLPLHFAVRSGIKAKVLLKNVNSHDPMGN